MKHPSFSFERIKLENRVQLFLKLTDPVARRIDDVLNALEDELAKREALTPDARDELRLAKMLAAKLAEASRRGTNDARRWTEESRSFHFLKYRLQALESLLKEAFEEGALPDLTPLRKAASALTELLLLAE
ncbi:hypothetical protein FE782_01155 [Paenibacillus antri]|uniref:Uncharacterized protein n=1 Tax=Paenibacillus antri TaxID=2582848 RepID=A0A5R9GKG7_9BACL|nr:hypothetical protein [Paenibacillus antri]TLS53988.1 hypothetical protein FE782_01155 [Paenibacillus antri]